MILCRNHNEAKQWIKANLQQSLEQSHSNSIDWSRATWSNLSQGPLGRVLIRQSVASSFPLHLPLDQ